MLTFAAGAARAGQYTHEVLPGESISKIAKRYHVTPAALRKLNRLKSDALRAGQKLKVRTPIPARSRFKSKYAIKRGDTLAAVAKKHKMSVPLLKRMNPKAIGALHAGRTLWVITEGPQPKGKGLYGLESGPGFQVLEGSRAYGTMLTVTRVAEVLSDHSMKYPDASSVLVGDISRERGGFLPPHRSHRRGRDVDIRYPLNTFTKQFVAATRDTLDLKRTWSLIRAFIKTGDVEYIFVDTRLQRILYDYAVEKGLSKAQLTELFQFPRAPHSMTGIIRHEPGHRTHFHVRFKPTTDDNGPTS